SAAGSSFRLPVVQSDWTAASEYLRDERFALYGAAVEGRPVGEVRGERVAIVVGNEGAGLSGAVQATVDDLVGVPLRGRAESLNVAAAAAILLYELTR
ncbi:MAG: RNA methyltransferase, partial [Gemmatimonadota bacterium]